MGHKVVNVFDLDNGGSLNVPKRHEVKIRKAQEFISGSLNGVTAAQIKDSFGWSKYTVVNVLLKISLIAGSDLFVEARKVRKGRNVNHCNYYKLKTSE